MQRYRTIVADPPWEYGEDFVSYSGTRRSARPLPYDSMTLNELEAMPISDLADHDARLFLWTTQRYLPDAFPIIESWGFTYCATITWHKLAASPFSNTKVSKFTDSEFLLAGYRGKPLRGDPFPGLVIAAPRTGRHSQKPELFLDLIEALSPGPYLELFARRQRLGWDTWGNEALEHVQL